VIVPEENAIEAALIPDIAIIPARNISELVKILTGESPMTPQPASSIADIVNHSTEHVIDFSQIVGQ
jgi:predicted ATPase with chaperone activity